MSDTTATGRDPRLAWPSVTRILAAAGLSDWHNVSLEQVRRGREHGVHESTLAYILNGVPQDVLDRKAEIGQHVHLAVHDIEQGMAVAWWDGEPWSGYVEAYKKFKEEASYAASATEELVFNSTHRYRGTLDSRGNLGTTEALLDIKTTVAMPVGIGYQLAGYDLCLPLNPKRVRLGVQLMPDATYKIHEYKDKLDARLFLCAVSIANKKGLQSL